MTNPSRVVPAVPGAAENDAESTRGAVDGGFLRAVDELYEPLCRYLYLISTDAELSLELAQEAFLKLHRELLNGASIVSAKAWLFRVSYNLFVDRARGTRDQASLTDDSVARQVEAHYQRRTPNPEELLLEQERLRRLNGALQILPSVQRHCLQLRREGFRYREIAAILSIGETTVVDHVRRAIERLARELHES